MKSKLILLIVLAASLLLMVLGSSGCAATGVIAAVQQPVISSMPSIANPVVPPVTNNDATNQQGIWVNGEGTVSVTPDIATVNLGVVAQASTVAAAQSEANTAVNNILSALTSNGVDQKDIQTQYYSIEQITSPIGITPPVPTATPNSNMPAIIISPTTTSFQITEYQVSNTVTATIRAIDKTGLIIDAAVAAGGNLTQLQGVSFSVDQPEQYYTQARQLAMNDAASKASQFASLAGVTLGKPTYISENTSSQVVYPMELGSTTIASSAGTSINPGETDIVIDVQVAYAIQ